MGTGTFTIGLVIGAGIMMAIFLYTTGIIMGTTWKIIFTIMGGIVFGVILDLIVNHKL